MCATTHHRLRSRSSEIQEYNVLHLVWGMDSKNFHLSFWMPIIIPYRTILHGNTKVYGVPSGVRTPADMVYSLRCFPQRTRRKRVQEWKTVVDNRDIPALPSSCTLLPTSNRDDAYSLKSINAHVHHPRNVVDKTPKLPKYCFACSSPYYQTTIVSIPQEKAFMAFGRDGRRKSAPPPCAADLGFGSTPEEVDGPGCPWGWHRWHNKVCFVP